MNSYVFKWDEDRIETVAAVLRWYAKHANGETSDIAYAAAEDLRQASISGARFVRRGAE